jgi:O-antigen/teichoic acid export membrane protein
MNDRAERAAAAPARPPTVQEPASDLVEFTSLARGGAVSLIALVINAVLTFAFFLLAGRTLGASQAAPLFEGIALLTIATYAAVLGMDAGLLKLMPVYRREHPGSMTRLAVTALVPPLVMGGAIAVVIYLTAPQLASLVVTHSTTGSEARDLRVFAPFIPLSAALTVGSAGLRAWSVRESVMLPFAVVPILRLPLLSVFVVIGITPFLACVSWGVPIGVAAVLTAVLLFALTQTEGRRRSRGSRARVPLKEIGLSLSRFGGPRSLGGVFQVLVSWLDVLLVGALDSGKAAAAYAVASRYIATCTFPLQAVGLAISPQLSRLASERKNATIRQLYQESTWWVMALSWPMLLVTVIFAPFLMSLFGADYAGGVIALEILGAAMLISTGAGCNTVVLLMAGNSVANLTINLVSLILNVSLNLLLIPHIGIKGAAIAWAVTIAFSNLATGVLLWTKFRMHPFGRGFVIVALSSLATFGVVGLAIRLAVGSHFVGAVIGIAACSVIYVLLLRRFRKPLDLDRFRDIVVGRLRS